MSKRSKTKSRPQQAPQPIDAGERILGFDQHEEEALVRDEINALCAQIQKTMGKAMDKGIQSPDELVPLVSLLNTRLARASQYHDRITGHINTILKDIERRQRRILEPAIRAEGRLWSLIREHAPALGLGAADIAAIDQMQAAGQRISAELGRRLRAPRRS